MAYTTGYIYNVFLDHIDKAGSDLYSPAQVGELLESVTYGFIDNLFKYDENTTQWADLLDPLYRPYSISLAINPTNANEMIGTKDPQILHIKTGNVTDSVVTVRNTTLIRQGELDARNLNPNKKATNKYPLVIFYNDTIAVYGANTFTKIEGFCIHRPTFGDFNVNTDIAVNLPDQTIQLILDKMKSEIFNRQADQRLEGSLIQEQKFGKY